MDKESLDFEWWAREQKLVHYNSKVQAISFVAPGYAIALSAWKEANARLRAKIASIAGDFQPDRDSDAPQALQEMREALMALAENAP